MSASSRARRAARRVAAIALAAALLVESARAEAEPEHGALPCPGCLYVPARAEAGSGPDSRRPLLVLLHGDRQSPQRMVQAFRAMARRRDVALLAPPCPKELGCDQRSFWRWGADPSWLNDLVDRVVANRDHDPDRVALVGWSGGATYLGSRIGALGERYSAAILVGGGVAPRDCAEHPLPVFLLQGDRNPLHHLAVALRRRLQECEHEVVWQLVPRGDHAAEWRALTRPAAQRTIFDFLDAHPRHRSPASTNTPSR